MKIFIIAIITAMALILFLIGCQLFSYLAQSTTEKEIDNRIKEHDEFVARFNNQLNISVNNILSYPVTASMAKEDKINLVYTDIMKTLDISSIKYVKENFTDSQMFIKSVIDFKFMQFSDTEDIKKSANQRFADTLGQMFGMNDNDD